MAYTSKTNINYSLNLYESTSIINQKSYQLIKPVCHPLSDNYRTRQIQLTNQNILNNLIPQNTTQQSTTRRSESQSKLDSHRSITFNTSVLIKKPFKHHKKDPAKTNEIPQLQIMSFEAAVNQGLKKTTIESDNKMVVTN